MSYEPKHRWITDAHGKRFQIGSTQYKLLEFLYLAGEGGARHRDVLRFYIGLRGLVYDPSHHRGYGSSYFTYRLPRWTTKNDEGRWVLTDPNLISHFDSSDSYNKQEKFIKEILNRLIYSDNKISKKIESKIRSKLYGTL